MRQLRQEILRVEPARRRRPGRARDRQPAGFASPIERLDRCLLALQQIDANANVATLIECWVDDLGQAYLAQLRHDLRQL